MPQRYIFASLFVLATLATFAASADITAAPQQTNAEVEQFCVKMTGAIDDDVRRYRNNELPTYETICLKSCILRRLANIAYNADEDHRMCVQHMFYNLISKAD